MENLTIVERQPVIIDGCRVPFEVYDPVHLEACATGKTQFIGVVYEQPEHLKRQPDEPLWDWDCITQRDTVRRLHFYAGQHLRFITGHFRDELMGMPGVAMILWIAPWAG
jgi:hypothetical protein